MKELTAAAVLGLHALHLMLRKAKPVTVREIRRSSRFAPDRIRSVLGRLLKAGLIQGRQGSGYVLARAPGEIALRDVVQAIDAPRAPKAPCGGDYDACDSRASCILAPICRSAEKGYQEALRSFTLAELANIPLDLPNCLDPAVQAGAS